MKGLFDGFSNAIKEIKDELEKAARELETTQLPKGQSKPTNARRVNNPNPTQATQGTQLSNNQNRSRQVSVEDIIKGLDKGFRNYDDERRRTSTNQNTNPRNSSAQRQSNTQQKPRTQKPNTTGQTSSGTMRGRPSSEGESIGNERLQKTRNLSDRASNLEKKQGRMDQYRIEDDSALNPRSYEAQNWDRESYKPIQKDSFSPVEYVDRVTSTQVEIGDLEIIPKDTLEIIKRLKSTSKLQTAKEAFIYSEIFNRKRRF